MSNKKGTVKKILEETTKPLEEIIYIITKNDPYDSTATGRNTFHLILCKYNVDVIINTMITGI